MLTGSLSSPPRNWQCCPTALSAALFILLSVASVSKVFAQAREKPLDKQASMQAFEVADGFALQLVASEPWIVDPVDVAIDDHGRLWVVEMRDYPLLRQGRPTGQIVILSDTNRDGQYDTRHSFAEQLDMPTGLALWKDGVLVTLAGQLVHIRDTDGDLRADTQEVWLQGFATENEQLRANHPRLGPDGWWYIANGLRGGTLTRGSQGSNKQSQDEPTTWQLGSRDVRIHPRSHQVELLTGGAQFGLSFDALGNRYVCSNRNPAVRIVLPQSVLEGNPLTGLVAPVHDVVPAGEASRVFPLVDAWTTSNLHAGQFTAACGVLVRSEMTVDGCMRHELYCCEPTGSLVKRSRTRGSLPREIATSFPADREWLASRDPWFRPVNLQLAPGGGLLVIDMHRAVIEHPQWVPEELKLRPDERWGERAGRIYVVYPSSTGSTALENSLDIVALQSQPLSQRSNTELVAHVANDDEWLRHLASRLLIEREAVEVADQLIAQATDGQRLLPARLASLWTAAALFSDQSLPAIFHAVLESADTPTDLRLAALNVLASRPRSPSTRDWHSVLRCCLETTAAEPDLSLAAWTCLAHLRATAAVDLRAEIDELLAPATLERAAAAANQDAYHAMVIASLYADVPIEFTSVWLAKLQDAESGELKPDQVAFISRAWMARCLLFTESKLDGLLDQILAQLSQEDVLSGTSRAQLAALAACGEGLGRQSDRFRLALDDVFWAGLQTAIGHSIQSLGSSEEQLSAWEQAALDAAVQLLAFAPGNAVTEMLRDVAVGAYDPRFSGGVITAWSSRNDPACDEFLVAQLAGGGPAIRGLATRLLTQRPQGLAKVVAAIRSEELKPARLGPTALQSFVAAAKGETAARLREYLDVLVNSNRRQIVEKYQPCLSLPADMQRGQSLFRTHCAACHRIGDVGYQVGPDISDSRTQQPLQLLTAILDPNMAIDNNYVRTLALTHDGQIFEGVVVEETGDAIVIRGAEAKQTVLARGDIEQLTTTAVSLMPEGFEAQVDLQSMADLIAYIKGWRYMDGAVPGQ